MHKVLTCQKGHRIHLHVQKDGRVSKVANFTGDYCCIHALAKALQNLRPTPWAKT